MREIIILATGKEIFADDRIASNLLALGRAVLKPRSEPDKIVYIETWCGRVVDVPEKIALSMIKNHYAIMTTKEAFELQKTQRLVKEDKQNKDLERLLNEQKPGYQVSGGGI